MKAKKIILTGIVLALIGAFVGYKMYNKPHVQVAEEKAEVTINAQSLIYAFTTDEDKANATYSEKIVAVKGIVNSITSEEGKTIVSLKPEGAMEGVLCYLSASENTKVSSLTKGASVEIKGICTGFLLDVVLINCVITN